MIYVQNLIKRLGGKTVLDNISYHFPQGEHIALVGDNGAGKSTLLNILCNLDEADEGTLIKPKGLVLGYLPQEPNPNPAETILKECLDGAQRIKAVEHVRDQYLKEMAESYSDELYEAYEKAENEFQAIGGYELESEAKKYLVGLGFSTEQFEDSPLELSGGWRMRLELARILVNKPNFLILDEPTNHLDLPSLIWLETYLKTFDGTVLFVSHDRALLNRLAAITLHLQQGSLTAYTGNYDQFVAQRDLINTQTEAQAKGLQNKQAELQKFVDRFGAKASKAAQAQSRQKMIDKLKEEEKSLKLPQAQRVISADLKIASPSGKQVLKLNKAAVGYSSPVAKNLSLSLQRGQRVAIIGANGIGKSTLVKTLANCLPLLQGELELGHNVMLGYHAQNHLDSLDAQETALENVLRSNTELSEQTVRSLLGQFLIQKDEVFKKVSVLSGGEKNRVSLCCLLAQQANFLILDEPTNHLDMSSADILANTLADFKGTILFVSHDRAFIDTVATHIFVVANANQSALFEGKLKDYEEVAERSGFPNILKA
ncbi:MAG: ABC-F family ATP-binding cassette domain-containing protein [Alphaproteobacteria bacterium]|nr:ABC-F family ATP-binding cassette domain-containing protein [Alphaproteobacteria bacterium]